MHIGGAQELAKRIPIRHYIDHGPSVEEREQVAGFQTAYAALQAGAKHTVVAPGDRLPLRGVDWRIVSSAGKALKTSLPAQRGVRQPKFATPARDADRRKRPVGRQRDPSGSDALVHGLNPRVAIMQNGTRKGGTLQTYQALRSAPRTPDIRQAHWSYNGLVEHNRLACSSPTSTNQPRWPGC